MKIKKGFKILLYAVVAVIIIISVCMIYVNYGIYIREKYTHEYLESIGYDNSEIKQIKANYQINLESTPWSTEVIFEDEPTVIYYYYYEGKTKMSQGGVSGGSVDIDKKHAEEWYYRK
jgi:hypothetical protein